MKFQWANDHTAVRFITSVDHANYESAGFIINGTYGNHTITNKTRTVTKVYQSLLDNGTKKYPKYIMCDSSEYFVTYTVGGMSADVASTWNIRALFVTPDGTTVQGNYSYENEYIP